MERKYVKTFESEGWRKIVDKDHKRWTISVSTSADTLGLSEEVLTKAMDSMNHPAVREFFDEHESKVRAESPGGVGEWQSRKSVEFEEGFKNSLNVNFTDGKINVSWSYQIDTPYDWSVGDISSWSPGVHKILQDYTFAATDDFKWLQANRDEYDTVRKVLQNLIKSQDFNIRCGDDTYTFTPGEHDWKINGEYAN